MALVIFKQVPFGQICINAHNGTGLHLLSRCYAHVVDFVSVDLVQGVQLEGQLVVIAQNEILPNIQPIVIFLVNSEG